MKQQFDAAQRRNQWATLPAPARPHFTSLELALFGLILVLAAALRLYRLDGSSLWSDEGNTWALMARSFGQIARDAAADIHPPGYYWLLKLWTAAAGSSAYALRSFSALAGVALIWVIYAIGRQITQRRAGIAWPALSAALLAAANPFQIYYSQEARMYMLLTLAGAGLLWATIAMSTSTAADDAASKRWSGWRLSRGELVFLLCGIVGLWIHYSFPMLLLCAAVAFGLALAVRTRALGWDRATTHAALRFLALNLLIVLAYLPWLPTAITRLLAWPKGGATIDLATGLHSTLQMIVLGPLAQRPDLQWPWLAVGLLAPAVGMAALRRRPQLAALALWLLAPIGLMAAFGLFTPAYLKFLLVASPAWCLLAAASVTALDKVSARLAPTLALLLMLGGAALAALTLPAYYASPTARDNYQGIAAYLAAVGDPASDLVLLDAPGQSEVWAYYDPALPVLALPAQRPAEREEIETALAAATADRDRVYALFWATDEADPEQVVEQWLNRHAFKGLESWQGNVRFVMYGLAQDLACQDAPAVAFGDLLTLQAVCWPNKPQQVAPGDVALLQLQWTAQQAIERNFKLTLQLLDARNQVIAQQDGEPAGGAQPTSSWSVGATVVDNHGLAIPVGAPPGDYRLALAVYDPTSGQRLPTAAGDMLLLGSLTVTRPTRGFPSAIAPAQQRVMRALGPVTLVGYDSYKRGYGHAPATPLRPGDLLHVTLYWQAPTPLPGDWPADLQFTLRLGGQSLTAPLAGGAYATAGWQAGELVRGDFDLVFDGTERMPVVEVAGMTLRLRRVPTE